MQQFGQRQEMNLNISIKPMKIINKANEAIASFPTLSYFSSKISSKRLRPSFRQISSVFDAYFGSVLG